MPAGTAPGPVGDGLIGHDFFVEELSALRYPSVGHLEAPINEVCSPLALPHEHSRALAANKVLHLSGYNLCVHFQNEIANGLVLCPSDPNDTNFMTNNDENLWAIDFGLTNFLPPSFVNYSLSSSSNSFVKKRSTSYRLSKICQPPSDECSRG